MKKATPLFGISLAILFVILGIYTGTDASRHNPDGSLSWQNYTGFGCALFFGCILVAALWRLITGWTKL